MSAVDPPPQERCAPAPSALSLSEHVDLDLDLDLELDVAECSTVLNTILC